VVEAKVRFAGVTAALLPLGEPGAPRYLEVPPSPALAPWIECFWSIRVGPRPPVVNRVLPDGCADLIVGVDGAGGATVVGTMRSALLVPLAGPARLVGVRFHPGAALRIFDASLAELTDRRIPLELLWGRAAEELAAALHRADTVDGARRAEHLIAERLGRATRRPADDEALAQRAVALLRRARGGVGVREVAAALDVGERRLQRAFDRSVGLSPKVLGRVLRLRRAIRRLDSAGRPLTWAGVAAAAGFADQAHLIREFRALAGITPAAYVRERRAVGFVQYPQTAGG
jgi:AraC-like DNA-binding protein